ncbi:MAG TPA: FAD:protein FMN transferase [Acidimicrobiia bacterium]|nr:FAD:protein FMN transferase [Acidimicrobiia bacterium]
MIHVTFKAMGTDVEAWCAEENAVRELRCWFEEVEQVCSRFRHDSELSQVNTSTNCSIALSDTLAEVISAGDRARDLTGGLVDIGVGAGVADWGYDKTFELVRPLDRAPWRNAAPEWSLESRTLTRSPSTLLDLGGIAKGWACDRAVETGMATVVSAGGDIRSIDSRTTVPILDPWGEAAARVLLGAGGLATSSIARRRWKVGNREVSHLIDPRTMAPVQTPILSATVVAGSAVDAETGAKAVLLQGEDGLVWAAEADWIESAIVVWHDGSVYATPGTEVAA